MNYIQVDARGCGVGKTRHTIIPRIKNNIKNRIKTLVVVPSKDLQKEYAKHFDFEQITVINSEEGNRIYQQYELADTPVICLTHEGFVQTPHHLYEKLNCDLIIDEAINPYSSLTFKTNDSGGRVWINYAELVAWRYPEYTPDFRPTVEPQPYFELEFVLSTAPDMIDRKTWQKLTNPNYKVWSTWETGNNLQTQQAETATVQLELNSDLLRGWGSVWIAAAVFEKTFMAYWLDSNSISYSVEYAFEKHRSRSVWHIPCEEFSWSKNYRNKNQSVETVFRNYINNTRNGKLIYNSNNDSNTVFVFGKRINHNAHGVNAYSHLTDYAFMSAIKPHPQFRNFIIQRCGSDSKQLEFAFAGYMAYQLLMRSALRDPNNSTSVNLFFLDTAQALTIMELFEPDSYEVKLIEEIQGNVSRPLSASERNKRWRDKQKASQKANESINNFNTIVSLRDVKD